jgi:predicted SprT family Zn-dependent metalloprotease
LQHALTKFHAVAAPLIDKFKKHKVEPSSIVLRDMPTRWGSCTPKGKIILNPELIKAPKGCIEYVIIHELCHLIHHDHTQKFVALANKRNERLGKVENEIGEVISVRSQPKQSKKI